MDYEIINESVNYALFGLDDAAAGVVIGSIIGGIVNLVGNLWNSHSTKTTNEKNISATQKENEKAREFEEEMYNNYESIPAQAQQYREAGVNPIQAVSPQSIGHASTSPIPQSQSPQFGNALIDSFPAFLEAGTTLRQQRIQRQEEVNQELLNWKQAFDNGTAEEQFNLLKQEIKSRVALTRADKRNRDKEIEQLELTFNMAKEAYDRGINPNVDDHHAKAMGNVKTASEIAKTNSETKLNIVQTALSSFELRLSKKFDERFMQLDYAQRKKEVEEFLDTSDMRVSLFNVQKAFAKLAVDEATRQDVLNQLRYRYDKVILEKIAEAAENGSALDGVLLQYLTQSPQSVIDIFSAVSNSISNFKPSPVKSKK